MASLPTLLFISTVVHKFNICKLGTPCIRLLIHAIVLVCVILAISLKYIYFFYLPTPQLLGLPDVDDDTFEEYNADVEEDEPEADHQQMGVSQQ